MQVFHLKKGARICIDFENSSVISMEFRGEEMISGRTPLFFVKLNYKKRKLSLTA